MFKRDFFSVLAGEPLGTPSSAPSTYHEVVALDGPVFWFWFLFNFPPTSENNRGTQEEPAIQIAISNGVTAFQPSLVAMAEDASLLFDGANGYAVSVQPSINMNRNFSIEIWFELAAGGVRALMSQGRGGWYLGIDNDNKLLFMQSQGTIIGVGTTTLVVGEIYHAAVTINGSGDYIGYLNGSVEFGGSTAVVFAQIWTGDPVILIGIDAFSEPDRHYWSGRLDEPAIYDYVLPPSRVTAHHEMGNGLFSALA